MRSSMGKVIHSREGTGSPHLCRSLELLRQWTDYLEVQELAPRTIHQYRMAVLTFLSQVLLDLTEVTERDVIAHLRTLTSKAGTKATRLRGLQAFYRWAHGRGFVVEDPTAGIHQRHRPHGPAPYITEEDLIRLFLAAWAHRPQDPRRAPALMFLYGTGARIESACAVTAEDVRAGEVYFRVAKGDRPYRQPLGPTARWAVEELLRLKEYRNPQAKERRDTLVGVGSGRLWQWVNDASRESGVKAHPHLLRHTFGTNLAESTDPAVWADLMNHSDLSQYRRYRGVRESSKREALSRV